MEFSPPPADAATRRKTLRAAAVAAREALTLAHRSALMRPLETHLTALVGRLAPTRLAFCWPYRGEPDLRAWVTRWLAEDAARVALLPVVPHKAGAMSFRPWVPGMVMPLDRHGIPHPPEGVAMTPDAVLIPCNVFDAAGYRLGYGAGYFDRTLAEIDSIPIGIAFEAARVETVWPQSHDLPMAWIVTERGAFAPLA